LIVLRVCRRRRRRRNSSATRGRRALIPSKNRSVTHGRRAELSTITRKERPSGIRPTSFYGRTPYAAPCIHHTAVRTDKTFQFVVRCRKVTVSVDRVKPGYILDGTRHDITTNTSSPPAQTHSSPTTVATPPTQAPLTTCSGRSVHFLARFNLSYSNP
jgi:hypothetical protein